MPVVGDLVHSLQDFLSGLKSRIPLDFAFHLETMPTPAKIVHFPRIYFFGEK